MVIDEPDAGRDAGALRDARRDTARPSDEAAVTIDAAGEADSYVRYQEDACPSIVIDPPSIECDPFGAVSGCPDGEGCYPLPPRASDNCHPGSYATRCFRAGTGMQGDSCSGGDDCAGGFICVKSSVGDRCVKVCRVGEYGGCGSGRMCIEVDVTGANLGGCQ